MADWTLVTPAPATPATPLHREWWALGTVFVGGTIGTGVREALSLVLPAPTSFPIVIFGINVAGAFLLGLLLEALLRRGPDGGRRRVLRLLLGTGVLGGFTTYSALADDTALLLGGSDAGTAILYAAATVGVGALASWAGIALAARGRGRTS